MGKKKTALDKAIEKIDGDIAVLQAARARLVDEQMSANVRKAQRQPKPVAAAQEA